MGLFDSFSPSSNFAKGIKLICDELNIKITIDTELTGDNQRKIYSYSGDIISGNMINPGISGNIVMDIFRYLQSRYAGHESELMALSPKEQDRLLNKLFGTVSIVDFTLEVMNKSVISKGLSPNNILSEKDMRIIRDVYGN